MSELQNGAVSALRRQAGRHSASTCRPGRASTGRPGLLRCLIGNLTVLEPYRPLFIGAALPKTVIMQAEVRSARFRRVRHLDFLDRGRAGHGRAWISLCRSIFC